MPATVRITFPRKDLSLWSPGAYVRKHTLVSSRYTTVNVIKTVEELLGLDSIGLNDTFATPMSEVFDPTHASWSYKAIVPDVLRSTKLPLPPDEHAKIAYPRGSAGYWAKAMASQNFSDPDRVDPVTFNRALWRGLKGNAPYPAVTVLRRPAEPAGRHHPWPHPGLTPPRAGSHLARRGPRWRGI